MKLNPWLQWWEHHRALAQDAPQVIAARTQMMQGPWTLGTMVESHTMVMEKWMAMFEAWQTLWVGPWSKAWSTSWRRPSSAAAWTGMPSSRQVESWVRSGNRALDPFSRRVKANHARLGSTTRKRR